MRTIIPLKERKLDIVFLGYFWFNLVFITYLFDLEQIVITFNIAGMVRESLAAIVVLLELVTLDHRAHRTVDDQNSFSKGPRERVSTMDLGHSELLSDRSTSGSFRME